MSMTPRTANAPQRFDLSIAKLANLSVIIAFLAICIFFSLTTDTFLTTANLFNLVVNNVVLLAIVALGMTFVIAAGGIDLSVGTSIDVSSMVFLMLLSAGYGSLAGLGGAMSAALIVGLLNAFLVTRLHISPFLATLGVLFIGQSTQQLATDGGQPIYLVTSDAGAIFTTIARTSLLGIPTPVIVLIVAIVFTYLALHKTVFGRYVAALGAQPGVAWYSGIRVSRHMSLVFILSALLCGVVGVLLSATVRSYVPLSGNAFLLDAIGATFIGTTLSSERRPSVIGTLLGVLLLAVVKNGLLLIGWNFYWQQVGIGVLVFLVLAIAFGTRSFGQNH